MITVLPCVLCSSSHLITLSFPSLFGPFLVRNPVTAGSTYVHVNDSSHPKIVYSDHAPSLIKASETPDWAAIGDQVGAQGTDWRLTAKGCSWRNGLAERIIRSARHTLSHELNLGETVDFHQFGAILAVVGSILNSRPLTVQTSPEGEYHALAPRDILFGRAGRSLDRVSRDLEFTQDMDQDIALRSLSSDQAKIVQAWRKRWLEAVFPDMVARPKWRTTVRNLQPGDIGHVKYTRKVGEDEWRLAMVETADADPDGIVRSHGRFSSQTQE